MEKEQTLEEALNEYLYAVDDLVDEIVKDKFILFRWYLRIKYRSFIINGTLGEWGKQNFEASKRKYYENKQKQ